MALFHHYKKLHCQTQILFLLLQVKIVLRRYKLLDLFLCSRIRRHHANGGILAAICAAPTVFGELGLLAEESATCYPGMEDGLFCKEISDKKSVLSGKILTSRGAGTAADFAFSLLALLKGKEIANHLSRAMCYEEAEA